MQTLYFLTRGEQKYGPYTVDDVRRYLAAGNVAADDLLEPQAGGSAVTAASLVAEHSQPAGSGAPSLDAGFPSLSQPGAFPSGPSQPGGLPYGAPSMLSTVPPNVPPPPGMDWWLVLILSIVTCSLFGLVWAFIQSRWVKKIDPSSRATLYLFLTVLVFPIIVGLAIGQVILQEAGGGAEVMGVVFGIVILVVGLGATVAGIASFISMSNSLSAATSHWGAARIELGGAFVAVVAISWFTNIIFLVAPVWIQYHFDRVRQAQMAGFSGGSAGPHAF